MLINHVNLSRLKYYLSTLIISLKCNELKGQLFSHSNALFCYQILTQTRQNLLKELYYYHTTEYNVTRQGFYHQSDIPSLTLPNFQVKK